MPPSPLQKCPLFTHPLATKKNYFNKKKIIYNQTPPRKICKSYTTDQWKKRVLSKKNIGYI